MKILHCADLHLGSRLTSLPTGEIRDTRKNEILKTFNNLIDYARKNDINKVMFSGDVFDSDRPSKRDKTFFYDAIRANKDIIFFYLRGNHDKEESLITELDNLKTFSEDWTSYRFDDLVISGIELSHNNNSSLYSTLSLNKNDINLVMLHGDVINKGKEFINLKKLSNKNIDYLALGHIHKYEEFTIDKRGIAIYPGCLDGRGFDELGEKGFVVIDIEDKTINYSFVPFSSRIIEEIEIDLSSLNNLYEAKEKIKSEINSINRSSIVKIKLVGKVNFDINNIERDICSFFKDNFFFLKVYSELKQIVSVEEYINDFSLKGEFVRNIISNSELKEEEKEELLNIGLRLLNGEVIE